MASVRLLVLPRGGDASSGDSEGASTLTTGAIAGIACGAGALFLGAAGLFIIYWRRQRRYDREDDSDCDSFDVERHGDTTPAVTYTMDYKMDGPQPEGAGDHASSYAYSPEKVLSPMSTSDTASAMPTHPAYIPRALVRGSSTPSNRSARTTSPPPFPTPPFPSGGLHPKTQPDDTIIQAYLAAAQAGTPPPHIQQQLQLHQYQQQQHYRSESESSSGLPIQHPAQFPPISATTPPPLPSQPHSASSTDASQHPLHPDHHQTRTISGPQLPSYPYPQHLQQQQQQEPSAGLPSQPNRKPRAYPPPPLNLADPSSTNTSGPGPIGPTRSKSEKPLHGKLGTTISGPLAFPHLVHPPSGSLPTTNTTPSGWSREEGGISHDSSHGGAGADDSAAEGQQQQKRSFRSRAWGFGSGSGGGGSGGDGSGGGSWGGKGKDKKHRRKRSNRNSGGGGYAGNRHYAEIEIGRESDLW